MIAVAEALVVTVFGKPVTQGSKTRTKWGMRDDNADRLRPWREAVKQAALDELAATADRLAVHTWGGSQNDECGPCGVSRSDADVTSGDAPAWQRIEGPVLVDVVFTFDRPKSAPKRRPCWPITRSSGDLDKLQRALFDALTDAGVWRDDSQVVDVHARKVHVGDAGALHIPGAVVAVGAVTAGA